MERRCQIVLPFRGTSCEDPTFNRVFQQGEEVWWDTTQTSNPVVFEQDNRPFSADRAEFLKNVTVPT
jgi:hypothetical protein